MKLIYGYTLACGYIAYTQLGEEGPLSSNKKKSTRDCYNCRTSLRCVAAWERKRNDVCYVSQTMQTNTVHRASIKRWIKNVSSHVSARESHVVSQTATRRHMARSNSLQSSRQIRPTRFNSARTESIDLWLHYNHELSWILYRHESWNRITAHGTARGPRINCQSDCGSQCPRAHAVFALPSD